MTYELEVCCVCEKDYSYNLNHIDSLLDVFASSIKEVSANNHSARQNDIISSLSKPRSGIFDKTDRFILDTGVQSLYSRS